MISSDQTEKQLKDQYSHLCSQGNVKIVDVWRLFKDFCDVKVTCNNDALLFQCGTFNFTGEDLFYFDFVRQFIFEEDGEYSHMEQLHCEFTFKPVLSLSTLQRNLWSYDTDNDFKTFFEQVEAMEEFIFVTKHFDIEKLQIKLELV